MADDRQRISGGICILLATMVLLVPIRWLLAAIAAAAFHEFCHYLAIRVLGGTGADVYLYSFAARMKLPPMSRGREVVCALAGPFGALCLLLLSRWLPRIALCAAMQSAYNLLPIYPMDGGRALKSGLLLILAPQKAEAVCLLAAMLCKLVICILAIYGCFWLKLGIFPLLMAALLLIRVK